MRLGPGGKRMARAFIVSCVTVLFVLGALSPTVVSAGRKKIKNPIIDDPLDAYKWSDDHRISYDSQWSWEPWLAVEGDNVHLVWDDDRFGHHYVYAIPPFEAPVLVDYYIYATDLYGNYNSTRRQLFYVSNVDNNPPIVNVRHVTSRLMGLETEIEAIVTDNSRVESVKLEYEDVFGNRFSSNMDLYYDDPRYFFTYRAKIHPQMAPGSVKYNIWAEDAFGNSIRTERREIMITSRDSMLPLINHNSPLTKLFGYEIYLETEIFDDAGVERVWLEYMDVQGVNHRTDMMHGENETYLLGVPPQPHEGVLTYSIWAIDAGGNVNRSSTYSIQIVTTDIEPPTIESPKIMNAVVGYWVPLHAFVRDNFGLDYHVVVDFNGNRVELGLLSTTGIHRVYYSRSTDGGRSWDDGLGNGDVERPLTFLGSIDDPRIAVVGETVHLVYWQNDFGLGTYYTVSRDNGATWSHPILIAEYGYGAELVVDGDNLFVVWIDWLWPEPLQRLHVTYSTDSGRTWTHGGLLNQTVTTKSPIRVDYDAPYLHVIFQYPLRVNLAYLRGKWTGDGFVWDDGRSHEGAAGILVNTKESLWRLMELGMSASDGKVHISYTTRFEYEVKELICNGMKETARSYLYRLHYLSSLNDGRDWSTPIVLVDHDNNPYQYRRCDKRLEPAKGRFIGYPFIASDDSAVYLVWSDTRDDNSTDEIYYKSADAKGRRWSQDMRLTQSEGALSYYAMMVVQDRTIHISWVDTRHAVRDVRGFDTFHQEEVYYKRFPDFLPEPPMPPVSNPSDLLQESAGPELRCTARKTVQIYGKSYQSS
jgi:hypothetical protein